MIRFPTVRAAAVWCLMAGMVAGATLPAGAMSVEERRKLDLSEYHVTDTKAGYFDVAARRAALASTQDPMLLSLMAEISASDQCPQSRQLTMPAGTVALPKFYEDRAGWLKDSAPYRQFEHVVSKLAARQFVLPDAGAGDCLLDLLARVARAGTFLDVDVKVSGLQTWFQVESSLFAASLAYSIVRDDIEGREDEKKAIEAWLVAAARHHLLYEGAEGGTCCNNHFYRRAVYAASIGILANDDDLFRVGISAVYSALSDATADGALELEMVREQYAAKYQVYAAMHLVFVAEMARRQGYDLYAVAVDGRTLSDVVDFAVAALLQPETAADAARTPGQDTVHLEDAQYFSWLEVLPANPRWSDSVSALLAAHRPSYNRSLGGYTTLYFLPLEQY